MTVDLTGGANVVSAEGPDGNMVRAGEESILAEMTEAVLADGVLDDEETPGSEAEEAEEVQEEVEEESGSDESDEDEPEPDDDRNERSQKLDARERRLAEQESSLETARRIENLLRYPEFRKKVGELLSEAQGPDFEWGQKDSSTNGVRDMLKGFKDHRLDEILPIVQRMEAATQVIEQAEARRDLNAMRDSFRAQFGEDVVSDSEWAEVEKSTAKRYRDNLTPEAIKLTAYERFTKKGVAKVASDSQKRVVDAMAKEPKGTKIVTGKSTAKQAAPRPFNWAKASQADMEAEIAKSVYR